MEGGRPLLGQAGSRGDCQWDLGAPRATWARPRSWRPGKSVEGQQGEARKSRPGGSLPWAGGQGAAEPTCTQSSSVEQRGGPDPCVSSPGPDP